MDDFRREISEFGDPFFDVEAVGIELFLLVPGVEDAEVGLGVAAGARDPLPIPIVDCRIVVDQCLRKVLFSPPPIDV